jgi:hypothetical protein
MSELDYIGADELVFNNDKETGVHSGGFSVKSIMMKAGMSPIMTLNMSQFGGKTDINKVSDLFDNLVVPNWVLTYNDRMTGGTDKYIGDKKQHDDNDTDSEDDVIDDDLHDKLLEIVKEYDIQKQKINSTYSTQNNSKLKKKITRKYKTTTNKKTKRRQ